MRTALTLALVITAAFPATAQIDDPFARAGLQSAASPTFGLSTDKLTAGLKEALAVSTTNAVAQTGKPDGFLKNDAIRIPLPDKLRSIGRTMKMLGMGAQVEELEIGMNRAAEQAAPKAKAIFLNSLKKMSFDDARKIFSGGDTAATDFFKRTCSQELAREFTPIVHESMANLGVIQRYDTLLKNAPGGMSLAGSLDIDKYVVGKALDGLFYMLSQEEKKIRQNPASRTTPLLQQVFGRR
jgi:hypothetical protein